MILNTLCAVLAAASFAAPVDFDQNLDVSALLTAARQQTQDMSSASPRLASTIGNIWTVTDDKKVTLQPGQAESAYLDMDSTMYKDVCENPFPPYTGPICRREPMFRDVRRFKLVLAAPIPEAWGAQTFHIRLDVSRRPTISIAAQDRTHAWQYKLPEIYEDVLMVTPLTAPQGVATSEAAAKAAGLQTAALTMCTLRDIVKDQCVYACNDGREIHRPVSQPNPDGTPTIACPQVLFPF